MASEQANNTDFQQVCRNILRDEELFLEGRLPGLLLRAFEQQVCMHNRCASFVLF